MEKLKLYKVTKASSDGTFNIGDIIWLSNNEDLNSCKGFRKVSGIILEVTILKLKNVPIII